MRIGLVMAGLPQYSETFLNNKIKGLQESGFDVIVFTGPGAKRQQTFFQYIPGFKISRNKIIQALRSIVILALTFFRAPAATSRFWKLQKQDRKSTGDVLKSIYANAHILPHKVDWLHYSFLTFALNRESLAKAIKARMSASIRGFDIAIYPVKNPGCFNTVWKYLDKLHTISDDLLEKAKTAGMPQATPVVKITPALDVSFFDPKPNPGVLANPVKFLTVGRLHWKKGYEQALIALAQLKKSGIPFSYTIIGTGEEEERLKFAAYALNIQKEVHFAGKLPHDEVRQRLQAADIYLQSSLQEGFCNAVLEAQFTGLLCVVSDAEGLRENVLHNITGWVVSRRNPTALAEEIKNVIALPHEKRKTIAAAAMERAKKDFNLENQKAAFAEFYRA
jgi:colanic acid/amylovoran biosynthesis glycosyltransferase